MNSYFAEFIGTAILILLGNGVVANVLLSKTKGQGTGLIVIATGWGAAVFVAVLCVHQFSSAHINPAVTIGLAVAGKHEWSQVPGYVGMQMLGAIVGAILVYVFYKQHYDETSDADLKLGTFCTSPSIRSVPHNMFSEVIGTFVLVYAVLLAIDPSFELGASGAKEKIEVGMGALGAAPVGMIVFAIGVSLGGTTGYAINPARDLGPRIAHAILPIKDKRDSDWAYSPIPVIGPIVGGILAALIYLAAH